MNHRRDFLKKGAAALGFAQAGAALPPAPTRPNILMVLSDDHSVPFVGCYGTQIQTPNLDRFASQGMRFDRAYVTCPQCMPSRASIFAGRSPIGMQMTRFSAPLPMDVRTFPEMLRAHGYFTGVAGRTYHMDGPERGMYPEVYGRMGLKTFPKRFDYVRTARGQQEYLPQLNEFLDLVPRSKPFYLQLCSGDPHRAYDKHAIPRPHDPAALKLPPHFPDTRLVREDLARYYDEVGRFDTFFGNVLKTIEKRGLADDTLVVFMGDNGGALLRGKGTLYELGINVPLIVRWPGRVKSGSSTRELISGEDMAPTFLEAAGLGPPEEMTGRSFLKLLRGESYRGRDHVFAQRSAHGRALPRSSANFDLGRAIVTRRHKLIYNALWQLPYDPVDFGGQPFWKELQKMNREGRLSPEMSRIYFSPKRPIFEIYDLENDPAELRNLAGRKETASIEHTLKMALSEWMIRERDYLPIPFPGAADGE